MSEKSKSTARTAAAVQPRKRRGFFRTMGLLVVALVYAVARAAKRAGFVKSLEAVVLAALCVVLVVIEVRMVLFNAPARSSPEEQRSSAQSQVVAPKEQPVVDLEVKATEETEPENLIREQTIIADGETQKQYSFDKPIRFGDSTKYASLPGIITFRGNNYRNGAAYGVADITKNKLSVAWEHDSSALMAPDGEVWTGSGWTGQPLIVTWPKETRKIMNMETWAKQQDELTEVVYATMDGHVYFYELETGKATREPLFLGFTFKGAGALDPRGWPILYVGAGYNGSRGPGRAFAVSLVDGEILYEFGAADAYSHRQGWTMFDGSPLVSPETDQLIYPGESGILYIIKLNTKYDEAKGTLTMDPDEPVRWRYEGVRTGDKFWVGIEASPVIWNHYLYMADNGGNLMCMDLDTLKLVWVQDTLDDTNCTPVLECEDGHPYIYISTSFHAGWRASENSSCEIPVWKIDALDGSVVWEHSYDCYTVSGVSGGVQGTPACGRNDLADMVFVPVARTGKNASAGVLAALDKRTGKTVWEFKTEMYSWSSPVDVYDSEGHGYILYPTAGGYLYLLDGATGKKLDEIDLGGNVEASCAVFNNMVVVGHRLQKIYGIKLS
ncbi:MAG: PQQ-like beta-propeller repeat protein [Oscillospiraceae bacterium]|nr:PQQ-like beta-propeller repeat protein [Oscillospiraceae bacterium]